VRLHLRLHLRSKAAEWRLASLDATRPAVVLCQHGRARSVAGAAKLRAAGVADVKARACFCIWHTAPLR
jgi:rhodanese-related sulfurtransferase